MVWAYAKKAKVPMIKNPVEIEVVYHHQFKKTDKRRIDIDNLVPKFILDGLVGVVIPDDCLEIVTKLSWTIIRDGGNRSNILIRELTE